MIDRAGARRASRRRPRAALARRALLAGLLALGLAGCAGAPLLDERVQVPASAELPLGLPAPIDARGDFAPWFSAELARDPRFGASSAADWLHGAPQLAGEATRPAGGLHGTSVLIVPGLFGDCLGAHSMPFADGADHPPDSRAVEAYRGYSDLGLHRLRMAELPGRASSAANAARLAAEIEREAADPAVRSIVLVAYSKGAADALEALERLRAADRLHKVGALVSVSGTVLGTPVADRYAGIYDRFGGAIDALDCSRSEGGEIDSVTRAVRMRWLAEHPLPPGVAFYSVVAHARHAELAPALRGTGALLSRIDPRNDGQMIAAHAVLPGSRVLADAHTDHWGIALAAHADPRWLVRMAGPRAEFPREALLRALLRYVAADTSARERPAAAIQPR